MDFEKGLKQLDLPNRSHEFCTNLYRSLCNTGWVNAEKTKVYTTSFRAAGDLVAQLVGKGDYMDFYMSGGEGTVDKEVQQALEKLGWFPCEWADAMMIAYPHDKPRYLAEKRFNQWIKDQNSLLDKNREELCSSHMLIDKDDIRFCATWMRRETWEEMKQRHKDPEELQADLRFDSTRQIIEGDDYKLQPSLQIYKKREFVLNQDGQVVDETNNPLF